MAALNSITPQSLLSLTTPKTHPKSKSIVSHVKGLSVSSQTIQIFSRNKQRSRVVVESVAKELDVISVQSGDCKDQQDGVVVETERAVEEREKVNQVVGGFGGEGRLSFEGAGEFQVFSSSPTSSSSSSSIGGDGGEENAEKLIDRAINATMVLTAGTFAITKLLTIDHDYWHGWTLYEILRYAPQHNWIAYEEALKTNPVLAKMMISGVVYSLGDWIAQCCEGKPLFEFDRVRMFRSGLVGFTLHGSLSHYYYQFCEVLFPFQDWWVVPVKVVFDQTAWSAVWNSIYYTVLGFLRLESPVSIFNELKATFWPMLTAGWKLWPFAHLITYGVIPVEQRLLWVDCVELIWVTILSTYSNEKSEARISTAPAEMDSSSPSLGPPEKAYIPDNPSTVKTKQTTKTKPCSEPKTSSPEAYIFSLPIIRKLQPLSIPIRPSQQAETQNLRGQNSGTTAATESLQKKPPLRDIHTGPDLPSTIPPSQALRNRSQKLSAPLTRLGSRSLICSHSSNSFLKKTEVSSRRRRAKKEEFDLADRHHDLGHLACREVSVDLATWAIIFGGRGRETESSSSSGAILDCYGIWIIPGQLSSVMQRSLIDIDITEEDISGIQNHRDFFCGKIRCNL
ncbi:hypothetical protein U1Q18_024177 [Sarracenia purpurea var. burkii]